MSRPAPGRPVAAAGGTLLLLLAAGCGEGPVEPRLIPSLAPGDLSVVRGPSEVRSVRLSGAVESRSYVLAVQNVGRAPGSLALALTVRGEGASEVPVPEASAGPERDPTPRPAAREPGVAGEARATLEARMREALRRAGARPYRPPRPARERPDPSGARASGERAGGDATVRAAAAAGRAEIEPGDTLVFRMAVSAGVSVDCADTTRLVRAVVRAAGARIALAEDLQVEDGFIPSDWTDLSRVLNDVVFPVDSAYFGAPADIDGNGKVVAVVTPEVNRLAPRGSETFIGGFFWPGDLSDRASCPASNRGEIFYLLAPDLAGRFGDPRTRPGARRNAMEVAAHELEHLISAQRRITLGGGGFESLEDAWLGEGMAHVAEEVVGLWAAGHGLRENLSSIGIGVGRSAAFETFIRADFERLGWHLRDPASTRGLATEDGSGLESLAMRGNAWIFLRWLADRFAPEGGEGPFSAADEPRLFRELASGGPTHLTGIENVERALRTLGSPVTWEELVAAYAPAPALDDVGEAGEPWLATWNLPEIFATLHESDGASPFDRPYPLEPTRVPLTRSTAARFEVDVTAFGVRYFVLESVGPTPDFVLELTDPAGRTLGASATPQMSLVRFR